MINILTYAVLLGCEFYALCAMTRGGRGWSPKLFGLLVLAAVDIAMEFVWHLGTVPPDMWLAVQFTVCWAVISCLIVSLSRDSIGRRIFLALCYGTYAIGYSSCFDVIVYRRIFREGGSGAAEFPNAGLVAAGLAAVLFLNLVFVHWILPRLPRDGRDFRWREPCLVAGVMFAAMFASCRWPVAVAFAPIRDCAPFVMASVAAWIVFPMVCGRMRERQRTADVEHGLELMMAEVRERRAAIDLARRLRHDQRHHRAQIAEYMLAGQYDRVFDYLKALDEEAQEAPTDKLVWCENETVNAILSGASRSATAKGVELAAEVHVGRTLPISDVQLVAVLANLIENAIEACEAAAGSPSEAGRSVPGRRDAVTVSLRQREHGLGITVTNPVSDDFALSGGGLPCAEPGIGLESIRRVVDRHCGQWTYEIKGGELKCQVILMFSTEGIT